MNVCTRLHLLHLSLKWRTVQRVKLVSKLIVLEFYLAFMLMILYGGVNIRCHWHGHFCRAPDSCRGPMRIFIGREVDLVTNGIDELCCNATFGHSIISNN